MNEHDVPSEDNILPSVRRFFDDARAQLSSTMHFGVLAGSIGDGGSGQTRRDYVIRHCSVLLRLKRAKEGLGLGSKCNSPSTDERENWSPMQRLSGLEICQAWAVLLNAGHLWGTFATERALMFELDRNHALREQFVGCAATSGDLSRRRIRGVVERELDAVGLHKFHYLLALWRLRDGGVSELGDADREQARTLLRAFIMEPSEKIRRLKHIFRRTRQLVYLTMHNSIRDARFRVDHVSDEDLRVLFPIDQAAGDWSADVRWQVFDAINQDHTAEVFGSSDAAARVLAHVEDFKKWWRGCDSDGLDHAHRVDTLFGTPRGWSRQDPVAYQHLVDFRFQSPVSWLAEVRLWLRDDEDRDPWGEDNFLVTPEPAGTNLRVDLYHRGDGLSYESVRHVARQLARLSASAQGKDSRQAVEASTARMVAAMFSASLVSGCELRLRPVRMSGGDVRYACVGRYELVRGMVRKVVAGCDDGQRVTELRQTIAVADRLGRWERLAVVLLCSMEIVRAGDVVTEIDGLVGFLERGGVDWLIVETKKEGAGDGGRQLRDKLGQVLLTPVPDVLESVTYCGEEAWHFVVPSPGPFR